LPHLRDGSAADSQDKDDYFDDNLLSPKKEKAQKTKAPSKSSSGDKEPEQWYSKLWSTVEEYIVILIDLFTEMLERRSALYREVVEKSVASSSGIASPASPAREAGEKEKSESRQKVEAAVEPATGEEGQEAAPMDHGEEVRSKEDRSGMEHGSEGRSELKQRRVREQVKDDSAGSAAAAPAEATFDFDHRVGLLGRHLPIQPSEDDQKRADEYEQQLMDQASFWTKRASRLLIALYYMFLSHSEYVVYFFIIVNVLLNGGALSLVYVSLLFGWGLLSNPWPSRTFWLIVIFYSMLVLVLKYAFQVVVVIVTNYRPEVNFTPVGGLTVFTALGIQFHSNFLSNAAWDMVLLIALLIHRGLLKVSQSVALEGLLG